jgi:serine/threonine protein kinase
MYTSTPNQQKQYISTIIHSVYDQLYCLYTNGWVYSDIKPPNILFNWTPTYFVVMLGDLGGCHRMGNIMKISTGCLLETDTPDDQEHTLHPTVNQFVTSIFIF